MPNQLSGQTGPSPRAYSQHQRYRRFARVLSGADQFSAFLAAQAAKLSISTATVFADLKKNTTARIKAAATTDDLS